MSAGFNQHATGSRTRLSALLTAFAKGDGQSRVDIFFKEEPQFHFAQAPASPRTDTTTSADF
jgi:hypothetical protein